MLLGYVDDTRWRCLAKLPVTGAAGRRAPRRNTVQGEGGGLLVGLRPINLTHCHSIWVLPVLKFWDLIANRGAGGALCTLHWLSTRLQSALGMACA